MDGGYPQPFAMECFSTELGFGDLIVAKWTRMMEHVANKHNDHPNPMFSNCAHGEIAPHSWIPNGIFVHSFHQPITTKNEQLLFIITSITMNRSYKKS